MVPARRQIFGAPGSIVRYVFRLTDEFRIKIATLFPKRLPLLALWHFRVFTRQQSEPNPILNSKERYFRSLLLLSPDFFESCPRSCDFGCSAAAGGPALGGAAAVGGLSNWCG